MANVAPTVTLDAGNDLSVSEGSAHTYSYTISDPGADTVSAVTTSCGANGTKVAGSDANTDTSGSFKCTFADGPSTLGGVGELDGLRRRDGQPGHANGDGRQCRAVGLADGSGDGG